MIALMKENLFDGSKAIWSLIKNFQNWSKKSLRCDHRTKGETSGKKYFRNTFLWVQNDCFDEKNVFDGFKAISSLIKNFQNWSKKSLRGDHRTKGGSIGKNFFWNIDLSVQNDCFDESVFDGFKAIWSLIENFQNCSKKRLKGDHRTKGGTIGKKFFRNMFL